MSYNSLKNIDFYTWISQNHSINEFKYNGNPIVKKDAEKLGNNLWLNNGFLKWLFLNDCHMKNESVYFIFDTLAAKC